MQRDIRHQWFFPHPPELIWDHLTQPELLALWLMENDFKPEVGHKFRFFTKPKIKLGFDGTVYCEVLEVIPFRKLVYSWRGGPGNGKVSLDSTVTWSLIARDGGTELQLVHAGFRGLRNYIPYLIMNKGWAKIGKRFGVKVDVNV